MSIESFLTTLERTKQSLKSKKTAYVSSAADKNLIKATVETWFRTYRPQVVGILGENHALGEIDSKLQQVLQCTWKNSKRENYLSSISDIINLFKKGLLTEVKISEWGHDRTKGDNLGNQEVKSGLIKLNPSLGQCYEQVILDLSSPRLSYRGTANELREILRESIDLLAPDDRVKSCPWFIEHRKNQKKEEDKKRGPTRAEKIRYILENKSMHSEIKTAQDTADLADSKLGAMVGKTLYGRVSSASHVQKDGSEIRQILSYINAVLLEILPN